MPHPAPAAKPTATTYPGVVTVAVASDQQLVIEFDNGETRIFDVTPLLAVGRFKELAAPEKFRRVRVAFDTVEWENGLDLDPEYVYERSEPCKPYEG